jgi:hypothetical protein
MSACCLLGLHFNPEDGGSTFIRNIDELRTQLDLRLSQL